MKINKFLSLCGDMYGIVCSEYAFETSRKDDNSIQMKYFIYLILFFDIIIIYKSILIVNFS